MFYFGNAFYFFNNSNDVLYKLPDNLAAGSTDVVPVIVNSGITAYGVSDTAAGGAGTLGDEAYFLGDTNNQLFRLYRIRWDATINNIEVDAGADTTFALGSVSQDAIGFSFAPTNTDRSWLTIVGNDLTILSAPDVTTDTDYSVIVRATRSGINVDKTLTVRVVGSVATTVVHISGNNQIDTVGTELSTPFLVEVRDQDGGALPGITVAFAATAGGGTLSDESVTTDSSGQAESTLTLGSTTGTNTVTATATGITTPVTFTATATATGTAVASYIHLVDPSDGNVRMILPPTSGGAASIIRAYTVAELNSPIGMAFDGTHIHIVDVTNDNIRMFLPPSADGEVTPDITYTVSGLNNAGGMTFDGTHIHIADINDNNVRMILPPSAGGQASIVRAYTVDGLGDPSGIAFDGEHIHIADFTDDNIRMILPPSAGGAASIVRTYTVLGVDNPRGITFDGTHIHIADINDDNIRMILIPSADGEVSAVRTYTVSGLGNAQGMTFDGGLTSQAILTLTTTVTDIRAGEAVDISIASDIDLTNFTASDITVTGGTRGALTGSGTSWTLAVTAGSAGTMTIAIAEDAVSPGNTAVSQDFPVTALVTGTITFDDGLGDSGGDTGVNIELSESVTGLALSDFTVVNGTLSNLQGTGTSYTATLNFPVSGTNTTTVTLRANTVSPSNAAIVATIIYFQVQTDAVLNITIDQTSVENSEVVNVTFTFDSAVTGFTAGDVVVTFGATKGALTNEGNNVYTMPVTAPSTGSGTIIVSVAEDRVSPGNNTDNVSFTYTTPVVALSFGSTISNQAWTVGTAESLTLPTATGGTGTITYSLSPTLPAGVTFTAGTRLLAGTPIGRFTSATFTYTAEDADGTTLDQTFTIVVTATAITFDSGINNQSWIVGTAVSVTTPSLSGGVGDLTYSITPALPAGVTFAAGTRLLSGTPTTAATSATYTYTGTDAEGITSSRTFSIVVAAAAVALSFGSEGIVDQAWVVGTAATLTLPEATGGEGTITYSLSPTPPTGVTFVASTRVLSGNPTVVFSSATFTYTAEDTDGTTVDLTFTIVVAAAADPLALSWIVPTSPVGNTLSVTLNSNYPITGVMIDDFRLRIEDNSDPIIALTTTNTTLTEVAGTNNWQLDIELTGTLDADYTMRLRSSTVQYDGNDYPPTFLVSDAFSIDSSLDNPDFGSETIDNQAWVVGTAVSLTLPEATGGTGTLTYSLSSTLPMGITFTAGTRVLAGTPTGRFTSATFTYTVEDADGTMVDLTFTIVVTAVAITFASTIAAQSWQVGTVVSLTLPAASGGVGAFTYSLSPTLPAGVSRSVRAVTGTPTTAVVSATYTYTAEDSEGETLEQTFTIVVAAAAVVLGFGTSTIAAQGWVVGTAFTVTLPTAIGGTGTKTYSLTGTLPTGATFVASTRVLSGTATGRFASTTFTYTVTDGDSDTAELTFMIVVTATFAFASVIPNQIWTVDEDETLTLPSATGGVGALTYALTGTLPMGMVRLDFEVSGTPTVSAGSMSFVWTVTDGEGVKETDTFTIVVEVSTVEADRLEAQRQSRLKTILPVSSSQLEVDLVEAFQEVLNEYVLESFGLPARSEIPVRHLWNPETCPVAFLPYLACAMSVDADISAFTVSQQRALIADSFEIHRRKGTVGSIKRIIDTLGWTLVTDGFVEGRRDTTDPSLIIRESGGWAQFTLEISNTIPIGQAREAVRLIQQVAPISRKVFSFDFSSVPKFYDGGVDAEGIFTFLSNGLFTHGSVLSDESIRS